MTTTNTTLKPAAAAAVVAVHSAQQQSQSIIDSQAQQIQQLESRIHDLEAAIHSSPVEVANADGSPTKVSLGELLHSKDETIAAKNDVIQKQQELIDLWKQKYHENWCTIL